MKKFIASMALMAFSLMSNGQSLSQFNALDQTIKQTPKTVKLGIGNMNGRAQLGLGYQINENSSLYYSHTNNDFKNSYNFLLITGNIKMQSRTHQLSYSRSISFNEGKNAIVFIVGLGATKYKFEERLTSLLTLESTNPDGVLTEGIYYANNTFTAAALWHKYKKRRDMYIGLRTNHANYSSLDINLEILEATYHSSGYKLPTIGPVVGYNWQNDRFSIGCQAGVQLGETLQIEIDESYEFHDETIVESSFMYFSPSQAYLSIQLGIFLNNKSGK